MSTGKELYKFHAPSGIIGNPISYMHKGKQYVAVLTGVGGWAAIGLAENLTKGTEGLGAVGEEREVRKHAADVERHRPEVQVEREIGHAAG